MRKTGEEFDVVVDGRDIGTVVFPDARLKVFLDAAPGERAKRRLLERLDRAPTDDEIAEETGKIMLRDELDALQSIRSPEAIVIDTTHLDQAEQIARLSSSREQRRHRETERVAARAYSRLWFHSSDCPRGRRQEMITKIFEKATDIAPFFQAGWLTSDKNLDTRASALLGSVSIFSP